MFDLHGVRKVGGYSITKPFILLEGYSIFSFTKVTLTKVFCESSHELGVIYKTVKIERGQRNPCDTEHHDFVNGIKRS